MIAYSFFDIGEKSLASIKGVYDPAYSKYSLGLYTMLKEIEYGMENEYEFYYPGYVVPGYSRFDYKLRIGKMTEVEFFDAKNKTWNKYNNFTESHILVKQLSAKLAKIAWALTKKNVSSQLLFYQIMDSQISFLRDNNSLKSPLILSLFNDLFEDVKFLIYFDIETDEFVFVHSLNIDKANPILSIKFNLEIPALDSLKEKGSVILRTKNEIKLIDQVILVSNILEGFDHVNKTISK